MIQLPQRSVTRFFIPLIDVLTLLFCIFLVMPLAQNNEESLMEQLRQKEAELERLHNQGADTRALQEELDRLRKQLRLADRFPPTRVLEIDAVSGQLFYRNPERINIRNRDDAQALIEMDRRELGLGKSQLYYLILYPRDRKSEHPLNSELDDYTRWFEGVKLKYDIPGKGLIQGVVIMANMLFEMNEWASRPDRILAVVGGAAVAGFGLPWLVKMAVRGWTGQQVPRWIMMSMRVVTGGLAGWLVALWLAAGGGGGLGGPGGFGFGTGTNSEDHKKPDATKTEDKKDEKRDDANNVSTLYVEVLGNETLRKKFGNNKADLDRYYRVNAEGGPQYLTLKGVEEHIRERAKGDPPLKNLILVSYDDGPAENVGRVSDLKDWAATPVVPGSDTRLAVSYVRRRGDAPVQ